MGFETKYVVSTLTSKELIGFKMMMSIIRINSFGGKQENYIFYCIFELNHYRFDQISSVDTHWNWH